MNISLIPQPQKLINKDGLFILKNAMTIAWEGSESEDVANLLAEYLQPSTGYQFKVVCGTNGDIVLKANDAKIIDEAGFADERYQLSIDTHQIQCIAENASGLARAIQTLRQLFPPAILAQEIQNEKWECPAVEIEDTPRFLWRGQHFDVCRHFFSVEEVCRLIDLCALHKLNMFHLHLTEDQGWRVEIKQYPKLTKIGSTRSCTVIGHHSDRPRKYDETPYSGFYTQEDLREIVAFAQRRHITVVPEIDMPGHMVAAIAAYPELGNLKEKLDVRCIWGISQNILNVEVSTIEFMKNVLSEIMDIFPSRFIHIGGDEAPKHEWSESKRVQQRMAELELKSENELQSWFIQQMDEHITQSGRRLIGWDEILEGGLAKGATIMSWRGEEGGINASSLGHDVVMCPQQYVYFDYYQMEPKGDEPLAIGGMTTVEKVYQYEPLSEKLAEDKKKHILGSQGQLWTEYMSTLSYVEYMGFPRICALAEGLWLEKDKKDYTDFLNRLKIHRQRLECLNVNAHPEPS